MNEALLEAYGEPSEVVTHLKEVAHRMRKVFGDDLPLHETLALYNVLNGWSWEFDDGFVTSSEKDLDGKDYDANREIWSIEAAFVAASLSDQMQDPERMRVIWGRNLGTDEYESASEKMWERMNKVARLRGVDE